MKITMPCGHPLVMSFNPLTSDVDGFKEVEIADKCPICDTPTNIELTSDELCIDEIQEIKG